MTMEEKIARINALARKAKAEGLTDEEKEELEEIVQFLRDPEKYTALGAHIPVDDKGLHLLLREHSAHLAVRDIAGAPHIAGQVPHKNHHEDHQQQPRDAKSSSLQSSSPLCDPMDALPALLRSEGTLLRSGARRWTECW